MTEQQARDVLESGGTIVNNGQLDDAVLRMLDRNVRAGRVIKYRAPGMVTGKLKTHYTMKRPVA